MKKLTAVEWQFDELQMAEKDYKNEVIDGWEYAKRKYFILKQAHKLFEEQIVDGIVQHQINRYNITSEQGILDIVLNAQDYYNKTFKQTES